MKRKSNHFKIRGHIDRQPPFYRETKAPNETFLLEIYMEDHNGKSQDVLHISGIVNERGQNLLAVAIPDELTKDIRVQTQGIILRSKETR